MTKRYSVWTERTMAEIKDPDHETWAQAEEERSRRGSFYRIWDRSTTPPTDVTEADPEAVKEQWWYMFWNYTKGYQPARKAESERLARRRQEHERRKRRRSERAA